MAMPTNAQTLTLQEAVLGYFAGERHAMLLVLSAAAVMAVIAVWTWAATRTGFATGFSATVLAISMLLSSMAGGLLVRDRTLSRHIVEGIHSTRQTSIVLAERKRICAVISKYSLYRRAVAIIALFSLLTLLLSDRDWVHGLVAGLLILVIAQITIDHLSQERAEAYLLSISSESACVAEGR